MATPEEFEQFVSHTVRIELKNGNTLHYNISSESKVALREQLLKSSYIPFSDRFVWFYIPEDRLVMINPNDLIRLTFLYELPDGTGPEYIDNFHAHFIPGEEDLEPDSKEDVSDEANRGWDLPQLIIMHNRQLENREIVAGVTMQTEGFFGNITFYNQMSEGDLDGIYFGPDPETGMCAMGTDTYLQFIDDDGEENFMPLQHLVVIEVTRELVMDDEMLELHLGKKPGN